MLPLTDADARAAAGEELCHSYTEICVPTRLRQQGLFNRYGFTCDCSRCAGATHEGEDVDFLMEVCGRGQRGRCVGGVREGST